MIKNYFAYGSNMFARRLLERVSSAKAFDTYYTLPAHDLRFHKIGTDGSSKCDAYETGDDAHFVIGRLFEIEQSQERMLDEVEGLHKGYEKKIVSVTDNHGKVEKAFTYYATSIDPSLRPYTWYKKYVVDGAKEGYLPDDYIEKIEMVAADKDQDKERDKKEMKLHNHKK